MSNFIGHLSLFGLMHRTKNGFATAMVPEKAEFKHLKILVFSLIIVKFFRFPCFYVFDAIPRVNVSERPRYKILNFKNKAFSDILDQTFE